MNSPGEDRTPDALGVNQPLIPLSYGTKRGFYWISNAGNGTPHLCLNNRPRAVFSVSDRRTIRITVFDCIVETFRQHRRIATMR